MTMSPPTVADEQGRIADVVERLQRRFPSVRPEDVVAVVTRAHLEHDDAAIRDFVPVLVEKRAREIIYSATRAHGV